MKKPVVIVLTPAERQCLLALARDENTAFRVRSHAVILLHSDDNWIKRQEKPLTHVLLAQKAGCSVSTVTMVRRRFVKGGMQVALFHNTPPRRACKITEEVGDALLRLTRSAPPEGCARWSLQRLADALVEQELISSISTVAVHVWLKKQGVLVGKEEA